MSADWIWTIVGAVVAVPVVILTVIWIWRKDIFLARIATRIGAQSTAGIHIGVRKKFYKRRKKRPRLVQSIILSGDNFSVFNPGALIWTDAAASRIVRESIKKGLLMFNPPAEMIQGHKERVEVRIARSASLREELISDLRGAGEPQFEEIDTTLYMEVNLTGSAFGITSYSPPEQLIIPTPAIWEFDLLPCRAGRQTLTLSVSMRVEAEGIISGRRGVSVLEKQIDIRVNIAFTAHRFVSNNWQWLIPTVLALAGAVAAWLVVPF